MGLTNGKLHMIVVTASNVVTRSSITPISMWVAGAVVTPMVTMDYTIVVLVSQAISCNSKNTEAETGDKMRQSSRQRGRPA
jgi:hypothetical protein